MARTLLVGVAAFLLVLPAAIASRFSFGAVLAAFSAAFADLLVRRAAAAIALSVVVAVAFLAPQLAGWIASYGRTPAQHLISVPLAGATLMFVLKFIHGFEEAFGLKDTAKYDPKGCLSVTVYVATALAVIAGLVAKSPLVAVGLLYFPVYFVAGALLSLRPGFRCGHAFGTLTQGTLTEVEKIGVLLLGRIRPLSVFLLGYPFLILLFSGYYWLTWHTDPRAFTAGGQPLQGPEFFKDFVYFSVVTIATVGYGDITPASGFARFLVCTEIFLGILLTTLVIGLIFSALRPQEPPEG